MPFVARYDGPEIVVRSCRSVLAQNGSWVAWRSWGRLAEVAQAPRSRRTPAIALRMSWLAGRAWWHAGIDDDDVGDDLADRAMTVQLAALAFNAVEPKQLARFWARALLWNIREADGVGVELVPTDATSFHLLLRPVADEKVGQNRIHFDLTTTSLDDQNNTVAELLAIGATHIDIGQDPTDTDVVLADPEGNEFCIIEPYNGLLASCPRLGAVNCDGTHALGCFWSEALGWPLVWDQDEETAIQAPDGTGPKITWSGPPLIPKLGAERLHFHVAPTLG